MESYSFIAYTVYTVDIFYAHEDDTESHRFLPLELHYYIFYGDLMFSIRVGCHKNVNHLAYEFNEFDVDPEL